MKVERTKGWWLDQARREADADMSAGQRPAGLEEERAYFEKLAATERRRADWLRSRCDEKDRHIAAQAKVLVATQDRVALLEAFLLRDEAEKQTMVGLLERVRQACLFSEDDGQIGVTTDPHIDAQLFSDICTALSQVAVRQARIDRNGGQGC